MNQVGGMQVRTGERKSKPATVVFIIDDDDSVREALQRLFRSVHLHAEVFGSATQFLDTELPDVPSCLVLDIRLPGVSGLDFQKQLAGAGIELPIIFMTGYGDIPMTARAMKAGAVDFLTKPFREQDMLDAVAEAIEKDRKRRTAVAVISELRRRFEELTAREREVMPMIAAGLLNKEIAAALTISEITVKIHRSSLMRKLNARTVPDLVRIADLLSAAPSPILADGHFTNQQSN
jgi:FixJ family two-component response regulator